MEAFVIENLHFAYAGQEKKALNGVNLTVKQGDFFVLCGPSGCGKTTLLRQLKPAIAPCGEKEGKVLFDGKPLAEYSHRETASAIGFVLQSPENQIVTDKVWHELAFGLESMGADRDTVCRRCGEMAAFFGIEGLYDRDTAELSGGQKQLLSLASVMVMQPRVLILDEPTAQLDPIAASAFLGALEKINRELGTTVILSEHRLEEALPMATACAFMEQGAISFQGTPVELGAYLKDKHHPMLEAMPCAMALWGSVDTDAPCPLTVNQGRSFLNNYFTDRVPQALPTEVQTAPGETVLKATQLCFRYVRQGPEVVKNLSLEAQRGKLLCILGGNGSGKTTTLKLLCGMEKPQRGEVFRKGKLCLLPQDPKLLFAGKTLLADLQEVTRDAERIREIAILCRIGDLLEQHPYDLSGGEQQRAALAKLLLQCPDILLLDEPTKGLDVQMKGLLAEILGKLKALEVCLVMVSHDVDFCARYADTCGLFFDGALVAVGTPRGFFAGNSFYTTAANRMARPFEPVAVTAEDVLTVMGETPAPAPIEIRSRPAAPTLAPTREKKLPLWRKIGAGLSGLGALGYFIYLSKTEQLMGEGLNLSRLCSYGIVLALLLAVAVFTGRSGKAYPIPQPKRQRLRKRTVVGAALCLILIPLTVTAGLVWIDSKQYYLTSLAVLAECMLPFLMVFEGRRPKARELTVIATLCAMAIAGRAAFYMVPQCKPVLAVTVIAGVALGGESGFLVGTLTMLVSNMLFGQGPWTPWQMFAMGIIGFLAGILYRKGWLRRSRLSLAAFGALCAVIIYGGIMNPAALLIWSREGLTWPMVLSYYITGFPMDMIHGIATALFLWFGAEPMLEKLDRIKVKYDLLE